MSAIESVWVVFRDDTADNNILGVFADVDSAQAFMAEIEEQFPKGCVLVSSFPVGWRFDYGSGSYDRAHGVQL